MKKSANKINIIENQRSERSRQVFKDAFLEILKETSYDDVSITAISERAGLSRHTFYNHFESKEDLLTTIIDSFLERMFSEVGKWENLFTDKRNEQKFAERFFQTWQENASIVKIMDIRDMDCLLINRLKNHFWNYYYVTNEQDISGANPELAEYVSNLNAYCFVGVFRQWFNDGMKFSPELMGQFTMHFIGTGLKKSAVEKFNESFRNKS